MVTSYDTMPMGIYTKIAGLAKGIREVKDELDANEIQVKIIAICEGMTEDEVLSLPIADYMEKVEAISFLQHDCPVRNIPKKYNFGKQSFVPALEVEAWTTAQFIDFQEMQKSDDVARLMSVIMIPEGHTYNDGYDIMKVMGVLNEYMTAVDINSLCAFFLQKYRNSLADLLTSSTREVLPKIKGWKARAQLMERTRKATRSLRNGDGFGM